MPISEAHGGSECENSIVCPNCGRCSRTATSHLPTEEGWVVVSHEREQHPFKEPNCVAGLTLDDANGMDLTGKSESHVQFVIPGLSKQWSISHLKEDSANAHNANGHPAELSCMTPGQIVSKCQEACAQFMAIASAFYNSAPSETQAQLRTQWQALCQAAHGVSELGSCGEGAVDDSASVISDSSSNTPGDVYEYFRLCREKFLIHERIRDLTLDEAASMESCSPSKEVLDKTCFAAKRAELQQALDTTEQELQIQKEACLARGLNPERYRHRRISSHPTNHETITEWLQRSSEIQGP